METRSPIGEASPPHQNICTRINISTRNISLYVYLYFDADTQYKVKKLIIFLSNLWLNPQLKVESYKLYNNKYIIASTQITNTEIFAFIAFLVFKLLNRKVLFINWKDKRNRERVGYFLRKKQISRVNYSKIINSRKVKLSGYFFRKHVRDRLSVLFQFAWLYL